MDFLYGFKYVNKFMLSCNSPAVYTTYLVYIELDLYSFIFCIVLNAIY